MTASSRPDPRERLARGLLAALVLLVLAFAAVAPWHGGFTVDDRVYTEMTRGVATCGVPGTTNGPADRFPELRARWHHFARGRLWGNYGPVYPYVVAPAFLLGGVRGVIRFGIALLAVVALATCALGRRITGDPLRGAAAAWLVLAATPVWLMTLVVSPYSFMLALTTWSVVAALAACDAAPGRDRLLGFVSGLLAGLAIGTHLLVVPLLFVLVLTLCTLRHDAPALLTLRAWTPDRRTLARGAAALAGASLTLVPLAAFNRFRYGTWNPITVGPCPWQACPRMVGTWGEHLGPWLVPVVLWATLSLVALRTAWRHRRARLAVALLAVAVALAVPVLHTRLGAMLAMAWAFLGDVSSFRMTGYFRLPDGLGNLSGRAAAKALLQCSPVLVLAPLARDADPARSRSLGLLAVLLAAHWAGLTLRAVLPVTNAVGWPYLHLRYNHPALPLLAVLAVAAWWDLPWRARHVLAGVVLAIGVGGWLATVHHDLGFARRFVLLRGTLALAAIAGLLVAWSRSGAPGRREVATWSVAAALALSVAITWGSDVASFAAFRSDGDAFTDRVARALPPRAALVSGSFVIDVVLSLRASRDLEYADLQEFPRPARLVPVVEHWTAHGRPVFVLHPSPAVFSPLADRLRLTPVDAAVGLYRLSLSTTGAPR